MRNFQRSSHPDSERRAVGAKRVLVVEDDASIRDLLTVVLGDEGLEVHAAADGHEGVRLARATDPAVVVLDAMMPGLGGAEVIARLRRPDGTLPFAVLVLTAAPDLADRLRAQLGHDAVMDKPFDITALAATVRQLAGVGDPGVPTTGVPTTGVPNTVSNTGVSNTPTRDRPRST
jgi:DNA-binding response OmpR family regulator